MSYFHISITTTYAVVTSLIITFFVTFIIADISFSSNDLLAAEQNQVAVFPGAEGFGTTTQAGRGGSVCIVDNLSDYGDGTLRSCLELNGPRSVIFKTSGTIAISESIRITSPFVSVYGQTAPGDGILLRSTPDSTGAPLIVSTHDVLIQHLRIRAGSSTKPSCCRDSLSISNSKPGQVYNVVVDHNSISWGADENADIWYDSNNITISNNIISEGLFENGSNDKGPTSRGLLIGSKNSHSISIHHNLFAHNHQRNPLVAADGVVDVVNNLVYHWTSRAAAQDSRHVGLKVNWVKNKFIAKTNNRYFVAVKNRLNVITNYKFEILKNKFEEEQTSSVGWGDILLTYKDHKPQAYFEGNIGFNRKNNNQPEWKIANTGYKERYKPDLNFHTTKRFNAPAITEVNANNLKKDLSNHVGASLPKRDVVDRRIIDQLHSNTGLIIDCVDPITDGSPLQCKLNAGGWPEFTKSLPVVDSDNDGIPDSFEMKLNTNPNFFDSILDSDKNGYTNLEEWIFSLGN